MNAPHPPTATRVLTECFLPKHHPPIRAPGKGWGMAALRLCNVARRQYTAAVQPLAVGAPGCTVLWQLGEGDSEGGGDDKRGGGGY